MSTDNRSTQERQEQLFRCNSVFIRTVLLHMSNSLYKRTKVKKELIQEEEEEDH